MDSVLIGALLDKLLVADLERELEGFVSPLSGLLPDRRLAGAVALAVRGILASRSPVITQAVQSVARSESEPWAAAKRVYRLMYNRRVPSGLLYEGLYRAGRKAVGSESPEYLVVAIDPVNFEKPYAKALEGVSTVHKSTPPDKDGKARLARGYPAITATVVNTRVPATAYADWFSYTKGFLSENRQIQRAIANTRGLYAGLRLRFVGDSRLDDQKVFGWMDGAKAEFVIAASHLNRIVEVYNAPLDRWERESLEELVGTVPWGCRWRVSFRRAGRVRLADVGVGWLPVRLPQSKQRLWALVVEEKEDEQAEGRTLVLLTNVRIEREADARRVYSDWRLKGRVEHGIINGARGRPPHTRPGAGAGCGGYAGAHAGEDEEAVRARAAGRTVRVPPGRELAAAGGVPAPQARRQAWARDRPGWAVPAPAGAVRRVADRGHPHPPRRRALPSPRPRTR